MFLIWYCFVSLLYLWLFPLKSMGPGIPLYKKGKVKKINLHIVYPAISKNKNMTSRTLGGMEVGGM